MALRDTKEGSWTFDLFGDLFADPAVCIISYCLPCVQYGVNAESVHGPSGSCPQHGLKYCLYSCLCLCGLVAGPTRQSVRQAYKLPPAPEGLGDESMTDCLTTTIPCTACFAMCQETNEIRARKVTSPLDPRDFDWAPTKTGLLAPKPATATTTTTAPAPAEMSKDVPAAGATTTTVTAAAEAVPAEAK